MRPDGWRASGNCMSCMASSGASGPGDWPTWRTTRSSRAGLFAIEDWRPVSRRPVSRWGPRSTDRSANWGCPRSVGDIRTSAFGLVILATTIPLILVRPSGRSEGDGTLAGRLGAEGGRKRYVCRVAGQAHRTCRTGAPARVLGHLRRQLPPGAGDVCDPRAPGGIPGGRRVHRMAAASFFSTSAVISIGGGLAAGAISDRIGRPRTYLGLAGVFALGYVSLLLTRDATHVVTLAVYIVAIGVANGGVGPVFTFLTDRLQGPRLGFLLGLQNIGFGTGATLGPYFAGAAFDLLGGYTLIFLRRRAPSSAPRSSSPPRHDAHRHPVVDPSSGQSFSPPVARTGEPHPRSASC